MPQKPTDSDPSPVAQPQRGTTAAAAVVADLQLAADGAAAERGPSPARVLRVLDEPWHPGKLTFWKPKNGGGWKMMLLFRDFR